MLINNIIRSSVGATLMVARREGRGMRPFTDEPTTSGDPQHRPSRSPLRMILGFSYVDAYYRRFIGPRCQSTLSTPPSHQSTYPLTIQPNSPFVILSSLPVILSASEGSPPQSETPHCTPINLHPPNFRYPSTI